MTNLTKAEKQAVAGFKNLVVTQYKDNVVEIKLFGSKARGEWNPEGDIDVLVVLKKCDWNDRDRIADLAFQCGYPYRVLLISPLVLSRKEYNEWKNRELLIIDEIEKDGIKL